MKSLQAQFSFCQPALMLCITSHCMQCAKHLHQFFRCPLLIDRSKHFIRHSLLLDRCTLSLYVDQGLQRQHRSFLPGPRRRRPPVLKCRRFVFSTLHCLGYIADLRYIAGSLLLGVLAGNRWVIEILSAILKITRHGSQGRDYSFLRNNTFPNLYDSLVYERKFKSEYLERHLRAIT